MAGRAGDRWVQTVHPHFILATERAARVPRAANRTSKSAIGPSRFPRPAQTPPHAPRRPAFISTALSSPHRFIHSRTRYATHARLFSHTRTSRTPHARHASPPSRNFRRPRAHREFLSRKKPKLPPFAVPPVSSLALAVSLFASVVAAPCAREACSVMAADCGGGRGAGEGAGRARGEQRGAAPPPPPVNAAAPVAAAPPSRRRRRRSEEKKTSVAHPRSPSSQIK